MRGFIARINRPIGPSLLLPDRNRHFPDQIISVPESKSPSFAPSINPFLASNDSMDPQQHDEIKSAVLEILKAANLEDMTEFKVRKLASEKLGMDLNASSHKKLVRKIVEDFLSSMAEADEKEATTEKEDTTEKLVAAGEDEKESEEAVYNAQPSRFTSKKPIVSNDRAQSGGQSGDQIICQLSNKRNVSIQEWRGKTLVSIREYYEKNGEMLPTSKGISLSIEQWEAFKSSVPAIEDAIRELQ